MDFKKKILFVTTLMVSILPQLSFSEEPVENYISLSDCTDATLANADGTVNKMVSGLSECIKDNQDISKAEETVEQTLLKETSVNLVEETGEFQEDIQYFIPFIITGGILLFIGKLKAGLETGNKSKSMIKFAWFLIISGVIFNPQVFQLFTYEILNRVFYNNLMIVQPQVVLMTQTVMENQEIALEDPNFEDKSKEVLFGLLNSELCALEQEQKALTKFGFDAKKEDLEASNYLKCLEDKKPSYAGFFESGGRSESNYLTKECTMQEESRSVDCGNVTISNISNNDMSHVEALIANKAIEANAIARSYISGSCNKAIEKIGEQKAEGLCRKVTDSGFELNKDKTLDEANKELLEFFNQFNAEFSIALGKGIEKKDINKNYNLLNLVSSMYGLLHSNEGSSNLVALEQDSMISSITFLESPGVSYITGLESTDEEREFANIEEINDLYANASNQMVSALHNDKYYKTNKYINKLDPLLWIGSYTNAEAKEGYMLDHSLYNKVLSLGNYFMGAGIGLKAIPILNTAYNSSFGSEEDGTSALRSRVSVIANMLSDTLIFMGMFVYWIFIIIAILMAELVMTIIITMIILMINLVLMYMSKQDPEVLAEQFMRLIMDISKTGGLIIGLLLSQVALTLSVDITMSLEEIFKVKNEYGVNSIEIVRAFAMPLAIIFFNVFLLYRFISLATENIAGRVNVISRSEELIQSRLAQGKATDAKHATNRFLKA